MFGGDAFHDHFCPRLEEEGGCGGKGRGRGEWDAKKFKGEVQGGGREKGRVKGSFREREMGIKWEGNENLEEGEREFRGRGMRI